MKGFLLFSLLLCSGGSWLFVSSQSIIFSSVDLDGTTGCFDVGNAAPFNQDGSTPFSTSIWAKYRSFPSANWTQLFGHNQEIYPALLGYELDTYDQGKIELFLIHYYDGGNYISVRTTAPVLSTGVWAHVVQTYDGSKTAAGVHIYVDTVDVPLTVNMDALVGSMDHAVGMTIGCGQNRQWVDGKLALPAFFTKELSPAEVAALHQKGDPSGMSGIYEFWNPGASPDVTSILGRLAGNNGTLHGTWSFSAEHP